MSVKAGHSTCRFAAIHRLAGLCTAVLASAALAPLDARAAQDRTISFYNIHNKETLTVQYKKGGRFLPEAMKKIDWILRDWRANKSITMDPNTIDIIWEMHRELGSQAPVHVISGYRSPDTNAMLRKTRGGQATKSQHMTGKAVDISFPDVPVRRLRYSAMVRERGGVGYYPTSGIPFVHVDTARVRHWPRMARDELALLFPSGRSKHAPADGRPISPSDVKKAREKRKDLAQEIAQFFALRDAPKAPVMMADASAWPARTAEAPPPKPPAPKLAARPQPPQPHRRMAVGAPMPSPAETAPERMAPVVALPSEVNPAATTKTAPDVPRLVAAARPAERPSPLIARLPESDRSRLDMLVQLAALDAPAAPAAKPAPVTAPVAAPASAATPPKAAPMKAALTPAWPFPTGAIGDTAATSTSSPEPTSPEPAPASHPLGEADTDWRSGWASAPAYDDDHPDELAYRPFELAPLLTETASFDDPALRTLVHPDGDQALDMLGDEGMALPMRFGTGHAQTAMTWAQAFSGSAVDLAALASPNPAGPDAATAPRLIARAVKTEPR